MRIWTLPPLRKRMAMPRFARQKGFLLNPFRFGGGGGGGGADPTTGVSSTGSGFSSAVTTGVTTTAGSTIVILSQFDAGTFVSITHSKTGTPTIIGAGFDNFGTSLGSRLHYLANNPGGSSHTFTLTCTGGGGAITILEILNTPTASPLDISNQQADGTSPYDSPGVTTAAGVEMLVGAIASPTGTAVVGANSFNVSVSNEAVYTGAIAVRLVTGSGTYNSSFTLTGTPTNPQVYIAAFKKA